MHDQHARMVKILDEYFDVADPYTYNLTRVKTSKIEVEDFEPIDSDTLSDIADLMLERGIIVPPAPIGSTIYMLVSRIPKVGSRLHTHVKVTKITYLNLERVMRDLGITVFLTEEEAKRRLEEIENGRH